MVLSVTNTFVNGNLIDAAEVNANFTDLENEWNGTTNTATRKRLYTLGSGTITLLTTTTAYDINYSDISIAAGDLAAGDTVIIKYMGLANSSRNIGMRIDIRDTTATGNMEVAAAISTTSTGIGIGEATLMQHPNSNDVIMGTHITFDGDGNSNTFMSTDTNDANVFTTAFTIRINAKNDAGTAAADTYIRWIAYRIQGL